MQRRLKKWWQDVPAEEAYQRACDTMDNATSPEDQAKGLAWLHTAAAKRHASAQYYLSLQYRVGFLPHVTEDAVFARQLLTAAAHGGHPIAQLQICRQLFDQHDKERGMEFLRKFARSNAVAQRWIEYIESGHDCRDCAEEETGDES